MNFALHTSILDMIVSPVFCVKQSGDKGQIKLTPSEWGLFFMWISENNRYDVLIKINIKSKFSEKKNAII